MKELVKVDLYTDGACSGNPGAGGWGYVLLCKDKEKKKSGYEEYTTNNKMELLAVIEGLKAIKKSCCVTIYTDSAYVYNPFALDWVSKWKSNNYRTTDSKPIANKELWIELFALIDSMSEVHWIKVKGHADNFYNNLCDELATKEIKKHKKDKKEEQPQTKKETKSEKDKK